jgi:hygromycin-B 7''-O-kinase
MMQEYSKRLGEISPEQFQAALTRLHLGNYVKAEPIQFGLFGQNVFLTSTKGEFVFRGAPHYPWQFPTEQFIVNQLYAHTHTPVPYPYQLESSNDIFGWSFVIMPRLPGLDLQDKVIASQLTFDDRLEITAALARMLAEVQTFAYRYAGKYDVETGSVKPFEKHYREWIVDGVREKVAVSQTYNDHTTPSDVEWIESVIAKANLVLHLPYDPCIVLGDYGEHNVLAMHTEGQWHISGVFDLMTAHFGDGRADLSLPVTDYLRKNERLADAFVTEYLRLKSMQPGFVEQQQLYMLDLKLNFWRYWQSTQGDMPGEKKSITFEEWARSSVEYWCKFSS